MSSDDIVERLWRMSAHLRTINDTDVREAIDDAADEIERLRGVLARHGYATHCEDYDCHCGTCVVEGCQCGQSRRDLIAPGATPDDEIHRLLLTLWHPTIADRWWDSPYVFNGATPRQMLAAGHRDQVIEAAEQSGPS